MTLLVTASVDGFGARVDGLRIDADLTPEQIEQIRAIWLAHQVIHFPNVPMTHTQLARFTRHFGEFGNDPFVEHLNDHPHVLEVRREPHEQSTPFGGSWHSDWSFQKHPPIATLLHAKTVPPVGGNTQFADGYRAFEALPTSLQDELQQLTAIHSARRAYTVEGFLAGGGPGRSMKIHPSNKALDTQEHPVVRTHAETGRKALWVNSVYTIGIKELPEQEAHRLLTWLCDHATQPRFLHSLQWQPNMLCMWDNRCTQHRAQGGYDGFRRIMHRTVVAAPAISEPATPVSGYG